MELLNVYAHWEYSNVNESPSVPYAIAHPRLRVYRMQLALPRRKTRETLTIPNLFRNLDTLGQSLVAHDPADGLSEMASIVGSLETDKVCA